MSSDSRPEVFIIESLALDDEKGDQFEGRRLKDKLDLSGKLCQYFYIRTRKELEEILKEFTRTRYRYLHVSCHGANRSGKRYLYTTFDEMDFADVGKILKPYINDRRVFISACQAASMSLAYTLMASTRCYSVMAPTNNINVHDAAFFWASFYHVMFKENDRSMKLETIREVGTTTAKLFKVRVKLFARKGRTITPYTLR
jgi:hypothetical protein